MEVSARSGRPSPDPGFSSVVELRRGDLHGSFNLISIGKTLTSERIAAEEAPPALLQVQPTGSLGNEHVLEAWVVCQPGACFQAVMAAQIVRDDENIPRGIVGFDGLEQLDVVLGIARSRATGDLLAIAHAQRSVDPHLLFSTTVLQRGLDAVAVGGPAGCRRKRAWDHRSEFVGTDGRRPCGWRGVVGDDRCPFGTKSLSSLFPQLCVRRQRTPSRT